MSRRQEIYLNAENPSGFFLNQFTRNKINYLLDSEHFKMLLKNIITTFALTGLAIATPVEDIEERQNVASCDPAKNWCCETAVSPLSLFFIRGVGKNCKRKAF